jgi:hypothetical protein
MNNEEALNEIKKALEKQIPIKPFLVGDGYANGKLVYEYGFVLRLKISDRCMKIDW